jgi:hypothetical protein
VYEPVGKQRRGGPGQGGPSLAVPDVGAGVGLGNRVTGPQPAVLTRHEGPLGWRRHRSKQRAVTSVLGDLLCGGSRPTSGQQRGTQLCDTSASVMPAVSHGLVWLTVLAHVYHLSLAGSLHHSTVWHS